MAEEKLRSGFDEFINKLASAVKDLSTIDVVSFSGTIDLDASTRKETALDPTELFRDLQLKTNISNLKMVALTHIDFDLDSTLFKSDDAKEVDLKIHNQAVQIAINARRAVIKLVKELIK